MKPARLFPLLDLAPVALLLGVGLVFGLLAPRFLEPQNLGNILVQCSSTAIVATGMTFVLLTAGVDLSVGAVMFVVAAIGGRLALGGAPLPLVFVAMVALGAAAGALNGGLILRLRIVPFIVTLATLYIGRGFALWFTGTRTVRPPGDFLEFGAARVLGVPMPVVVLVVVLGVAHLVLSRTPFGRRVHAVGRNAEAARKAGIDPHRVILAVYVICGACAAIGAIVSVCQLGVVAPTFATNKEFAAIAAAVLGGTSLFGGRGRVLPGTLFGAVLMQTVENGLVIVNADPYLYPLFAAGIIFTAVLLDSIRTGLLARLRRRLIRPLHAEVD